MNNLAVALDKVRAYLYGLRNAARDTLPEIWGLFKQHPVVPPNLFLSQQSVATRGSVAARATTTLGGGGMVVNLTINGLRSYRGAVGRDGAPRAVQRLQA